MAGINYNEDLYTEAIEILAFLEIMVASLPDDFILNKKVSKGFSFCLQVAIEKLTLCQLNEVSDTES